MAQDDQPQPSEARAQEAAAIRRRWITLGEGVAVLAVLISGLTLYFNWQDKRDARTQQVAQSRKNDARAQTLVLNAAQVEDKQIDLTALDQGQLIQGQTIRFPTALSLAPVETTGRPRIEASWFADALKRARDKAGLPDDSVGDERLPVAITTRYLVEGKSHEDVALYDIGYGIAGRFLAGHRLELRGLSRVTGAKAAAAQGAVDQRWRESVKG
ncbi:MAG: hypothetical protein ABW164_06540 [Sphingobium sp.]